MTTDWKEVEKVWYEKRYKGLVSYRPSVKSTLLQTSERFYAERVIALVGPGRTVLEIGSGEGVDSIECAKRGANLTAIDISETAVQLGTKLAKQFNLEDRAKFVVGDVENLPFPDNSFDVILNREVLSSVLFERTIDEIYRVIRPNGVFLSIECLGHNPVFNFNRTLKAKLGYRTRWAVDHILTEGDIERIGGLFGSYSVEHFHLTSGLLGPLLWSVPASFRRACIEKVDAFDRVLFGSKLFRRHSFKVVVEASATSKSF